MQAVILAAGKGTRMRDLVRTTPKSMLQIAGKTLLEWKFDALPESVDEVIIVTGYLGEKIRARFGDAFKGRKIVYVEQENPAGGTADALWHVRGSLKDTFLVLMGDDIYAREDMEMCLRYEWAILAGHVQDVSVGGQIIMENGDLSAIVEHEGSGPGLVSTNMFVLDTRVFKHAPVPKVVGSKELGLPQSVLAASQALHIPLRVVEATNWVQISDPTDLKRAQEILTDRVQ